MAVPRNRSSNARKNNKRSHHAKRKKVPLSCSRCGGSILPHCCCSSCGWYNNRRVLNISSDESSPS